MCQPRRDRLRARRRVRPDRPGRRQGVRAALAAATTSAWCTVPPPSRTSPTPRERWPDVSALPRGSTVRRDAGLYGYERALRRHGIEPIAGVDEAGRGACAGPLVAGAAILPPGKAGIVPGLADSKLLTEKARERCYEQVVRRARRLVGGGRSRTRSATGSACTSPTSRRCAARSRCSTCRPAYVLTDGFPVDGLGVPGPGGVEGRPGRRLHLGRLGAGQGDPGPDHARARRRVAGVRLQDPQGLHHRRAHRRARPSTARRRCTGCGSSTSGGPRGSSRAEPVQDEPVGPRAGHHGPMPRHVTGGAR